MKESATVLITGAARRLGRQISLTLAERGYNIALHYFMSKSEVITLENEINDRGVFCKSYCCDLSEMKATGDLIAKVQDDFANLDLLINNASVFESSDFPEGDLFAFGRHNDINFRAPYILAAKFSIDKSNGHIINILDTKISKNKIERFDYLLSKKALANFTEMAAVKLAPAVRVNAIAPGVILVPSNMTDEKKQKEYLLRHAQEVPLKKICRIENLVSAVNFLINNDFLTGQVIYVDGGYHLL